MKIPSCKIKEKLKRCRNVTIIPRCWRNDKRATLASSASGNEPLPSSDDSTSPGPVTNKHKKSFEWINISSFFSSSSKERVRDSSQNPSSIWFTPARSSASLEEAQESRESSERQPSLRAPSTISTPLSGTHSLTRINADDHRPPQDQSSPGEESTIQPRTVLEDQNSLGYMDFGAVDSYSDRGLFSWNDRHSNFGDSQSDQTDVQAGEVMKLEKRGVRSAVQTFWLKHDLSRNPFLPRPKHLKPARVRFPLGQ